MSKPMTDERLEYLENDVYLRSLPLDEACKEIRRLREEITNDRRFCICGCSMDEHENYGEDGFSCDNPHHECVLVCAAAAEIAKRLREENEWLRNSGNQESADACHDMAEEVITLQAELAKLRKVVEAAKECRRAHKEKMGPKPFAVRFIALCEALRDLEKDERQSRAERALRRTKERVE